MNVALNTPAPAAPATPSTPAAAPAAPGQVEINQNPVNGSNPVGSQAPERPPSDRIPSRREAIQAAFDKAPKAQGLEGKPTTEARKAADKAPAAEEPKLDLKKRPSDQPTGRNERGQFAPRQAEAAPAGERQPQPGEAGLAPQPAKPAVKLPEGAPYRDPPQRMADHAKAEWANAPESVRGEVYRMHEEFGRAYQQYRGDHEVMNTLRPFHQMAQQQGTTLDKALNNYLGIEAKLRADPIAALDQIVNNLGLTDPQSGQRIGLRDIAYHVLSQSPEQMQMVQHSNAQTAAQRQMQAMQQEMAALRNSMYQMHNQQRYSMTRAGIDQFADAHPRFDELGDLIKAELEHGYDLPTAYRRAELLRPASHAAQTRAQPAQTRTSDRSISGAPASAPNGNGTTPRKSDKPVERRTAIANAIGRARGSL